MTEYEYVHRQFNKNDETIHIPEAAVGISVDYFGEQAVVQYLGPV